MGINRKDSKMSENKVKSVTVIIKGKEVTLTPDELKELYQSLKNLVGDYPLYQFGTTTWPSIIEPLKITDEDPIITPVECPELFRYTDTSGTLRDSNGNIL